MSLYIERVDIVVGIGNENKFMFKEYLYEILKY